MTSVCHFRYVYNGALNCKINTRNGFCIPKNQYIDILGTILWQLIKKLIFHCVYAGHHGFMQIVGVAQSCQSGNQAKSVLEHIFITNQPEYFI